MSRPGFLMEVLGVFVATLFLVGTPALLMIEELRDPSCSYQVEEGGSPFRALAIDDHRIARCLGVEQEDASAGLVLAEKGSFHEGRALPDPTW